MTKILADNPAPRENPGGMEEMTVVTENPSGPENEHSEQSESTPMGDRPNPADLLEDFGDLVLPSAAILGSERLHVKATELINNNLPTSSPLMKAGVDVLAPLASGVTIYYLGDGEIWRSAAIGAGIAGMENAFSAVPMAIGSLTPSQSGQAGLGATQAAAALPAQGSMATDEADSGLLGTGQGIGDAQVVDETLETDGNFI